jgi:hypothetical protein
VGGGLFNDLCATTLANCIFSGNSADEDGGGAWLGFLPSASLTHCTFANNSAGLEGGSVFCIGTSPTFNSTIFAFSQGGGIFFYGSSCTSSVITYCDFFNVLNFGGSGIPSWLGQIVTTNANGDPCDKHFNILLRPMFADSASDFHLTDSSPCISAADPVCLYPTDIEGNPRPNPVCSRPDVGAYENSQGDCTGVEEDVSPLPERFVLAQNWPNPFKRSTTIRYALPHDCRVSLEVYNVLGRRVATLVDGEQPAGWRTAVWSGNDREGNPVGPGIYIVRFETGDFADTRKLMLVR